MLAVITVLAVAAMRSTSLGFIMSSNDAVQQNAFVAAEAGIEQAINVTVFNPANVTTASWPTGTGTNGSDSYSYVVTTQANGAAQGAVFGSSWTLFSSYQFQIVSTGTSARGASVVHNQGVALIAPNSTTVTGGTGGL